MSSSLPRAIAAVDNGSAASSTTKDRDRGADDAALTYSSASASASASAAAAAAGDASNNDHNSNMGPSSSSSTTALQSHAPARSTPSRKTSTNVAASASAAAAHTKKEHAQIAAVGSSASNQTTVAPSINITATRHSRKSRTSSPSASLSPKAQAHSSLPAADAAHLPPQSPRIPAASGYGTRSRNRAANAPRPNYAEDHDIDVELDLISPPYRRASAAVTTAHSSKNHPSSAAAVAAAANGNNAGAPTASTATSATTRAPYGSRKSTANAISMNGEKPEKPVRGYRSSNSFSAAKSRDKDAKEEKSAAHASLNGSAAASGSNQNATFATANNGATASTTTAPSNAGRKRKLPTNSKDYGNAKDPNHSNAKKIFIAPADIARKPGASFSARNMMSFENSRACLKNGKLKADDGTVLAPNDHVYLICEPPGEPYYIARIMQFLPAKDNPNGPVEMVRVNWYYRPRDISYRTNADRLLFASMQCDTCPLNSLRGKCTIKHRDEIDDLDAYKRQRDTFYFDKFYDRYIIRYYEVIPTSKVINVPAHVKKVLDERWKYVIAERGQKEVLCQKGKTCEKCQLFASTNESVDCAECKETYHMNCVDPPLTKKPQRGFAWTCAACARARERKMEARKTTIPTFNRRDGLGIFLDSESNPADDADMDSPDTGATTTATTTATTATASGSENKADASSARTPAVNDPTTVQTPTVRITEPLSLTPEQQKQLQLWPFRYFGLHSKPEDVLDFDDRINPRAKSRLGKNHQAEVPPWGGRPPVYIKKKKRGGRSAGGGGGGGGGGSDSRNTDVNIDWPGKADGAPQPPWIQDEPPGFIPRGEDEPVMVNGKEIRTAELLWKAPDDEFLRGKGDAGQQFPESCERGSGPVTDAPEEAGQALCSEDVSAEQRLSRFMDEYMRKAAVVADGKGIKPHSSNFLDLALKFLMQEDYNQEKALRRLKVINRYADLKEPHLRADQIKAFEAGVAKFGSELLQITRHIGTVPHKNIVRFYYMWKKTPAGKRIWGNFEGRRAKQARKALENNTAPAISGGDSPTKLLDDVADDQDDSAFDTDKAKSCKKGFVCKFCNTKKSREWRRAPWTSPGTTMSPDDCAAGDSKDTATTANGSSNGVTTSGHGKRGSNANGNHNTGPKGRDKSSLWPLTIALCHRCAIMWRKYGVQWEDPDEVARRIISGGSRSWRRKAEEEFLSQLLLGSETDVQINNATATTAQGLGINVIPVTPEDLEAAERKEQAGRKRSRMDKDNVASGADAPVTKRQRSDKAQHTAALPVPEAPLEPEPPRVRTLPCAVCNKVEPHGDQYLTCKDCRMSVHKTCYGVTSDAPSVNNGNEISLSSNPSKWLCDTCANDRDPRASLTYKCALCPVEYTEQELMEPPRASHRRKSDREREKERLEKEMVTEAIRLYRERQIHVGKPTNPREPLKRTEANNWVHVYCALFTPEVTFGDAKKLEPAEGLGLVARDRRLEMCRLCRQKDECGATVSCRNSSCNAKFHIGCARKEGYILGFDLVPAGKPAGRSVSRGSISNLDAPSGPVVKVGNETGVLVPAIWCSYHSLPNTFHEISEHVASQSGSLLQLYAQTYKQADLALTGTARKAAHLQQSVASASQAQRPQLRARRSSGPHNHGPEFDSIGVSRAQSRGPHDGLAPELSAQRMCTSCSATASPRWYPSQIFKVSEPHLPPSQAHPPFPGPPVNGVMAKMHEIYARKHAVGLRVNDRKEGVLVHAHPPPPAPLPPPRDQLNFPPPSELVQVTVYKCHRCHHQEMAAAQNANTSPVVTSQGVPGMSAPALSPEVAQPPPSMSHGFPASRPGMPVNAPPPANPVITLPPLQPPHAAAHPHIPPPAGHAPFSIGPPPPMSRASSAFSPAALPTTTAPIDRDRDVMPYAHQPGGVAAPPFSVSPSPQLQPNGFQSLSRRLSHQSQAGPPPQPIAPQPRHPSQAVPGLQAPPTHRSPYPSIAQPVTLPPPIPSAQAQHVSRQAPPPSHGHLHSRFSPGPGNRDPPGALPVTQPSYVPHGPLAAHNWPLNDLAAHPPPPGLRPPSVSHAPAPPPPVSIAPVSTSAAEAHHIPPPLFPAHAHPPPHIFRPRSNTSGFLPSLHMPSQLPPSTGPGPQSNVSGTSTNPSPNVIAASPGTVLTSIDPSPAMHAQDGSHYSEGAAEPGAGLENSNTTKDPPTSPKQGARRTTPTVKNLLI